MRGLLYPALTISILGYSLDLLYWLSLLKSSICGGVQSTPERRHSCCAICRCVEKNVISHRTNGTKLMLIHHRTTFRRSFECGWFRCDTTIARVVCIRCIYAASIRSGTHGKDLGRNCTIRFVDFGTIRKYVILRINIVIIGVIIHIIIITIIPIIVIIIITTLFYYTIAGSICGLSRNARWWYAEYDWE